MLLLEKQTAISLRKQGKTYAEIKSIIPSRIAKSTLSTWLKDLKLTKKQEKQLLLKTKKAGNLARLKGANTNRQKGLVTKKNAENYAKTIFKQYKNDPFFIAGLILYWCEGSKTQKGEISLINTDPAALKLFIIWLKKYLKISPKLLKARVFIHKPYEHEYNWNNLWSKLIQIPENQFYKPTIKPTPHKIKRKPSHQGCLRLNFSSIKTYHAVKYIIVLYKRYKRLHS